jgi:anti-sigma factor RsiW
MPRPSEHIDEELLESYALGRAPAPETGRIEEHLLVCEECRLRLTALDSFIPAIRSAARKARRKPLA